MYNCTMALVVLAINGTVNIQVWSWNYFDGTVLDGAFIPHLILQCVDHYARAVKQMETAQHVFLELD